MIRMISQYLGEDVFMAGIRRYIKKHAYGNTRTEDLWAALSEESGKDISKVASIWTKKVGYPVVTVTESADGNSDQLVLRNQPESNCRAHDERISRFQGENFDRNQRLVEQVEAVARRVGATNGQVALAWVLAQGRNVIPIPGTKHVAYLEENIGAANVRLSDADLAGLNALEAPVGSRFSVL